MKLQATKEVEVFFDKYYCNKLPLEKRERVSWKGCYYTIEPNEIFYFDRSNDWDLCYFKLSNGAEFKIDCGDVMYFINKYKIKNL